MIISTDIKDGVILAVVPAHQFVVLLDKREEIVLMLHVLFSALHLSQQP